MAPKDRRRMSEDEIERIAVAIIKLQQQQCEDCTSEGRDRHARHHRLIDRGEEFLDRLETTRWKILTAVLMAMSSLLTIAFITWIVLQILHIDLRKWR